MLISGQVPMSAHPLKSLPVQQPAHAQYKVAAAVRLKVPMLTYLNGLLPLPRLPPALMLFQRLHPAYAGS